MRYDNRWTIIDELGKGGQGRVFTAYDKQKYDVDNDIIPNLKNSIIAFTGSQTPTMKRDAFDSLRQELTKLAQMENPTEWGALKVLHEPEDARDSELAYERIKKEIMAMAGVSHPNLVGILDHDPDGKWLVTRYYPRGNLGDYLKWSNPFTGSIVNALKAFRPLVAAVAELHKSGVVHRDIKPENIFIGPEGDLNLGDFGLVFFEDDRQTRISATFENVGSRDWMPSWAYGCRIEDIRPSFDVFSLGKVLWRMVSDVPILPLWYFDKPQYDLRSKFPNARGISFINAFLKQCIVERQDDCLSSAIDLLDRIDEYLWYVDINVDGPGNDIVRRCKVCGIGKYRIVTDSDLSEIRNFGLEPGGTRSFKIFSCSHCGHVRLFYLPNPDDLPEAWQ